MKNREKYLFIDTNIYIQCCLLELEGDNLDSLNDLEKLLEKNKVKLLLPEVVELEFRKVLKNKFKELKDKIGTYKASINSDKTLDEKIKKDLISKLDESIKDREKNTENVEKKIEEIFKNKKFTKKLKIEEKYLVGAYKSFLSGEKPYKERLGAIQPDCVIIEILADYFEKNNNCELLFCSSNKIDFAENSMPGNDLIIHKDVKKRFNHIKYYRNLFELLNIEFKGKYTEESIEKLKEKEKEVEVSYNLISDSFGSNDQKISYLGNPSVFASGLLNNSDKKYWGSFDDVGINSDLLVSGGSLLSSNFKKHCRKCNQSYVHDGYSIDIGLCDLCSTGFISELGVSKYCRMCGASYENNSLLDNGLCDKCKKDRLII